MLFLFCLHKVANRFVNRSIFFCRRNNTTGIKISHIVWRTIENVSGSYKGDIVIDRYGRKIPKGAHGSINLSKYTASMSKIIDATIELFDKIINRHLSVRRLNITANHVISRTEYENIKVEQLNLFLQIDEAESLKEEKIQKTILDIKKKFGKNAILKGLNFEEGATGRERNNTIGGHRA